MTSKPKFRDLSDLLNYLPENERRLTVYLRDMVLECLPNCTEKISYNVPYFYLNKSVCFIWPGAVLWGSKRMYDGVRFGFTKGHLLSNEPDYFKREHRKYVTFRDFTSIDEIDTDLLRMYLFEAAEIDSSLL